MSNDGRRTRDHGLRRVNRLTGATLVGGLALTGGFSAVAAHAYSGATKSPATSTIDEAAADAVIGDGTDATSAPVPAIDVSPASEASAVIDTGAPTVAPKSRATTAPPAQTVPVAVTNEVPTEAATVTTASTTTRPKTVVTTPKRTRTTKPPVSGGS